MVTVAQPAQPISARPRTLQRRAHKPQAPFLLHTAPLLPAVICFSLGILLAHYLRFMPGLLSIALFSCFVIAAVTNMWATRLAWPAAALLCILLGIFCSCVAPGIDPQRRLALLADGLPRKIEGEIVRLGPMRTVASASPFSNKIHAIALVAIVLLSADPNSLFDSGMQMMLLSVVAVAGVASPIIEKTFGPYLHAMRNLGEIRIDPALPPRVAQFRVSLRMLAQYLKPLAGTFVAWKALPFAIRVLFRIAELLIVSTAIELFMMLPMAVYFHRVTLLALPVNLLIVSFLGILLPSAIVTLAAIVLVPWIAFIPAAVTAMLLHTVSRIVFAFSAINAADLRLPMPSPGAMALWIALSIAAICLVRLRRFGLLASAIALGTAAAVVAVPRSIQYRPHCLEIVAIDVGQGDSLLVITPDGKTLLIDAGGSVGASPDANFDIGEDVVSPVLWSGGIRRLDAVAITHAHADHIGGMPAVLEKFRPRELWIGNNPDVPSYDRVLAIAKRIGARIEPHIAGDTFTFGGVAVQVLAPRRDYHPGPAPANNDSLVLRVNFGKTSALLEGDAESPSENRMVQAGDLSSGLLKIGHHGSITSTTPAFLAAVAPSFAVISVGRRNFYGHPRREVLRELQSAHVKTFLTDMSGMTSFYLDGSSISAEAWPATHP